MPVRSVDATFLTFTQHNIIEIGPRATWWAEAPDLTKQKLPRQSIIRHPENMTKPPESLLCSLKLHRKGVALIQSFNIWHMAAQGNATDASQAVHLENSLRAIVLFHNRPCLSRIHVN